MGAVIGSNEYKKSYCEGKVEKWVQELQMLCEIAETHPQSAFAAYTKGFRSKFTFFQRTIGGIENYLQPVDEILTEKFIPKLFGSDTPEANLRELYALNPSEGGLGIPSVSKEARNQYSASVLLTKPHVMSIMNQDSMMRSTDHEGRTNEELKQVYRANKVAVKKQNMETLEEKLPTSTKQFMKQAQDKGASSWLTALPLEEMGFTLNKEEFRDALRLRYNLKLEDLPTWCACGQRFDVVHALSCKKGGFVAERHDNVKNILTKLLTKVCRDVKSEPRLIPINGESFDLRSANTTNEARLDIKAKGFWQRGQTAFFDVRITHINAGNQVGQSTKKIFRSHEMAKKREYLQRVLDVENGVFTPLVFGTNGGLGEECARFLSSLSAKISLKDDETYAHTITWIRTKLSFEILRSAIACVRWARIPFRTMDEIRDFDLLVQQGEIRE